MSPDEALGVLIGESAAVAERLPADADVKQFDVLSIIVPILIAVLGECTRSADSIRALARQSPTSSRRAVAKAARPIVAARVPWLLRLLFAGRIDREAEQVASAIVASGQDATVERIEAAIRAAQTPRVEQVRLKALEAHR